MILDQLVIVRGGGDIATGTIAALRHAGFPVLVLESRRPSAIRRTVALSEAVYDGSAKVEDVRVRLAENLDQAEYFLFEDGIAMLADPEGKAISAIVSSEEKYAEWDTSLTTLQSGGRHLFLTAVVDAILAKKNSGTRKGMAPLVIALGPGFTAGVDCDVVIETMRGHRLGRAIYEGSAMANTGTPGLIAGHDRDRVIHSPSQGIVHPLKEIGDLITGGEAIAEIENGGEMIPVPATFTGLLRGMIRDGYEVPAGFKIADIDPRAEQRENCHTISDKARAIGNAVLCEIVSYVAVNQNDTI